LRFMAHVVVPVCLIILDSDLIAKRAASMTGLEPI
jgi:hypothetical protein